MLPWGSRRGSTRRAMMVVRDGALDPLGATPDQAMTGLAFTLEEHHTRLGKVVAEMSAAGLDALEQAQAARAAEWVDATTVVSRHRWIKSPAELAYVRQACRYAEVALWAGVSACRPGRTENHVAAAMLAAMVEAGSETPAKNPLL